MKKTTGYRDRDRDLEIKMTPMIDVVFLLLVFFVWTASFHIVEKSLPTSVSAQLGVVESSEPPPKVDFDEIVIGILGRDDIQLFMNEVPLADLNDLDRRLNAVPDRVKHKVNVILHPDEQVLLGDVIDVLDVAQLAGFDKVQFAASAGER